MHFLSFNRPYTLVTLAALPLLVGGCSHHAKPTETSATEQPTEQDAQAATKKHHKGAKEKEAEVVEASNAKKRGITFSLKDQNFNYVEDGQVVRKGPISSGAANSPTPKGKYKVLSKTEFKTSSRYRNKLDMPAWMPWSMQFYGNYFMHEGWLPGYPDSHGCIRLNGDDAQFLYHRLRIGDSVVVQ